MRKKLIATSFSVAALVGVAGGVAYASAGDPAVTQTTTTAFGGVETVAPGAVGVPPTTAGPSAPGTIDPVAAQAVLDLLGVDATQLTCVADQLATGTVTIDDDQAALTVLQSCGISLGLLLDGLVALNDAASGAVPTTVPGAPTTGGEASTMVDMLQEQLAAQGITLTDEQAQCIVDNIGQFDMNDMNSIVNVLETCGISLQDIIPGG